MNKRIMRNNQSITQKIMDALKREFDLPFTIDHLNMNKGIRFRLFPSNKEENFFEAYIYLRDNIRFMATLIPQKYGRAFVSTMEQATDDMKSLFAAVIRELQVEDCQIAFSINGGLVNPLNIPSWPKKWDKVEIKLLKSPFFFLEESKHEIKEFVNIVIKTVSLFLALVPIERIENSESLFEGSEELIKSRKYERNPIARRICIEKKGCKCAICGFDFERAYGEIGKGFIEVHHIIPISSNGESHQINPESDLIPLCSNCHSMIHKRKPPFLPQELSSRLNKSINNG